MTKHTLKAPFADFNGTLMSAAGEPVITLTRTRTGGLTSHRYVAPTDTGAADQLRTRNFFRSIATAYKTISVQEAQGWIDAADAVNRTDSCGSGFTWTGYALFQAINWHSLNQDYDMQYVYGGSAAPPPIAGGIDHCHIDDEELVIQFSDAGPPFTGHVYLRISPPTSSTTRQAYPRTCRQMPENPQHSYSRPEGDKYAFLFETPGPEFQIGKYVGLLLTRLSENHTPIADPQFWPKVLITAP